MGASTRAGTSTLTTRLVLRLAEDLGGEGTGDRVLARAGLADRRAELQSAHGRVPYPVKVALLEAVAAELDDPDVGSLLGSAALRDPALAPFRAVVRALGSPAAVLRSVSRISTRLDTAAVFRCIDVDGDAARVGWRVLPPHRPHRIDCDYNVGMLRQVTVLFGLPPADVRHRSCQVQGDPECVYDVGWPRTPRRRPWRRRPRTPRPDLDAALLSDARLQVLQAATTDLVRGAGLEKTLEQVTLRADEALHAPGHLLDVRLPDGSRHLCSRGLGDAVVETLGDAPLRPGLHRVGDAEVLAVPVTGADRTHGVLAAVAWPGQAFFPEDESMLAAFGQHAGVALHMSGLLSRTREHEETARLLLTVARSLAGRRSVREIAQAVADAVPVLSSADRSAVALCEPGTGSVWVAGASGWGDGLAARVADYVTDTAASPELREMAAHGRPMLIDGSGSDWARGLLADFGLRAMAGVPIGVDGRMAGVVVASWADSRPPAALGEALVERLWGLAGVAGVALENTRLAEEVARQTTHDSLTGLLNRRAFEARLEELLVRPGEPDDACAVLFCDVSRLARINEVLGQEAGDEVLRQVADRLRAAVRETDVVARYNGDEFVVALPGPSGPAVSDVAHRVAAALAAPLTVAGEDVFVDLVVGRASADATAARRAGDPLAAARALVARAAEDMQSVRAGRRGGADGPAASADDLRLETDLHGAVERGEIAVYYQPQTDVGTGRVVGVEALARWQHPELGLVPPDVFVPMAESSGLIREIGEHVLAVACRTASGWRAAGHDLEVAVNVSAVQLADPGFAGAVLRAVRESGLPHAALTLEVTESRVVSDAAVRNGHLRRLRDLGIGISVDDFGTGYSSLSQLRRLPVTEIKVDRSFTAEVADGDGAVVRGIVGLGRGLGLRVVAEGVETAEQLRVLAAMGCDRAQGYLLGRPVPAGDLPALLGRGPTAPSGGLVPAGRR